MFRKEVRATLGNDFVRSGSSRGDNQPADLGIMKSLSEMGDGMKKRLNELAQEFSRRTNNGYTQAPQSERKPLIGKDGRVSLLYVATAANVQFLNV